MSASQVRRKIVVCGGNGFLGSEVCRSAVKRGWNVISLSRSGKAPPSRSVEWTSKVKWVKADVFEPATYSAELRDADAVVHSVGILLENDYKSVLRGTSPASVVTGLARMVSPTVASTLDEPRGDGGAAPATPPISYNRMNVESAVTLARALLDSRDRNLTGRTDEHGKIPFVYLSAAGPFPLLPSGYIRSKREAEERLLHARFAGLAPFFFRPGYMFPSGSGDQVASARSVLSLPIVAGGTVLSMLDDAVGKGSLARVFGEGATTRPLPVGDVGAAIVELVGRKLDGEAVSDRPVVDAREIGRLAGLGWRRHLA